MSESVIVVDFGGQYNQLIARRVRECHVYSEIVPYTKALDVIKAKRPRGIIFTGGPNSAYEDGAPAISTEVHPCTGYLLRRPAYDASVGRPCV